MAAYMRKTGILPVCTNNEVRAYFAGKGLTYADVTEGDILTLVMLLNKHIKKANADCETSMGSMYLSRRIDLKRKTNGALISCFLYVNSHYFERRECISFNADGWIGFAGWADQGNTNPILRAFIEWRDALAATKKRRTHNNDPLQVLFQLSRLPAGHFDRLRALLDRRQVRHRGRGGPHLPRPLHRRVRIVLYHP